MTINIKFKALLWCCLEALVSSMYLSYMNVGITVATAGYFTSLIDGAPTGKSFPEWLRKITRKEGNSNRNTLSHWQENFSKIREFEVSERNFRKCDLCERIPLAKFRNCQHAWCDLCLGNWITVDNKCPIDRQEVDYIDIYCKLPANNGNRFEMGESSNTNQPSAPIANENRPFENSSSNPNQPSAPVENENRSFEIEHGVRVHFEGYRRDDVLFDVCVICGKRNAATFAKSSECEHSFCDGCLLRWVKRCEACPYDGKVITDVHIYNNVHYVDADTGPSQQQLADLADAASSSSDTEKGVVEPDEEETLANGVILRRVKNARRKRPLSHCAICLETNVSEPLAKSSNCEHLFCAPCLENWAKQCRICPLDRSRIDRIDVFGTGKNAKKIIGRRKIGYLSAFFYFFRVYAVFFVIFHLLIEISIYLKNKIRE